MEDLVDTQDGDDDERLFELVITAEQAGGRLDAVIASALAALSRAQVQRLIEDGHVSVGGAVASKSLRVKQGDTIEVTVPAPEPLEVLPEPIPLVVLYEDPDLIVIDKPAGLVVHPAAGHARGTLVNALLHHCKDLAGIGGVLRPGIVHRLDKDTSGVMVATKTDRAHAALTAAFAAKSRGEPGGLERTYLAITSPAPPTKTGTLRTQYGRHPVHRKKFSSKVSGGKSAVTHWTVEEPLHEAALVRFRLETGRTHQIRVHASDHGWALIGDQVYGHKPRDERTADVATKLGRQALHAATLAFAHPATGDELEFESALPEDMQSALAALR
ncbi:MAG TPA: RluA family pseudouridine synthase [Kofleriaceae bacterium]|nr:RluA family pseudouridine synthase [Kofleriaceae bacterium]